MSIWAWVAVWALALASLLSVARVGEVRKPITGAEACATMICNGFLVWLIVSLAT